MRPLTRADSRATRFALATAESAIVVLRVGQRARAVLQPVLPELREQQVRAREAFAVEVGQRRRALEPFRRFHPRAALQRALGEQHQRVERDLGTLRTLDRRAHQLRYGLPTDSFLRRREDMRVNDIWTFLQSVPAGAA